MKKSLGIKKVKMSYEEPSYGKRKSRKEKKLKRRYRVYKKGGKFRTGTNKT